MATAKKGIVDEALSSKPVKTAKGLIDSAIDAFKDPPLAPKPLTVRKQRPAAKKSSARTPARKAAKRAGRTMDRGLVSAMEDYEVKYLAQKHGVTQKAVKAAVASVGSSRTKVEAELKRQK